MKRLAIASYRRRALTSMASCSKVRRTFISGSVKSRGCKINHVIDGESFEGVRQDENKKRVLMINRGGDGVLEERLVVLGLEVKVVRKRIKNMYLRVRRTGEVEVSAAPRVERKMIESFIVSKWSWVQAKRNQALLSLEKQLQADEIFYFGQRVTIKRHPAKKISVERGEETLHFFGPSTYDDERVVLWIKNWMFCELQQKIEQLVNAYWPYFHGKGCAPVEIKYRQMTATWGVCRPQRGTITFNKNLIHQPDAFIEYVVVHELSHLVEANHSARFYQVVELLLPEWKMYDKQKISF